MTPLSDLKNFCDPFNFYVTLVISRPISHTLIPNLQSVSMGDVGKYRLPTPLPLPNPILRARARPRSDLDFLGSSQLFWILLAYPHQMHHADSESAIRFVLRCWEVSITPYQTPKASERPRFSLSTSLKNRFKLRNGILRSNHLSFERARRADHEYTHRLARQCMYNYLGTIHKFILRPNMYWSAY